MSALDDARAVLANWSIPSTGPIGEIGDALAALVAECEAREALPFPEALPLRHGGNARLLSDDEDPIPS